MLVFQSVALSPVPLASETLSEVGKNVSKKVSARRYNYFHVMLTKYFLYIQAIVMSLPTIESSFVMHTTKGIQGFDHPEYPAVRVALEVLNATESYLWVSWLVKRTPSCS